MLQLSQLFILCALFLPPITGVCLTLRVDILLDTVASYYRKHIGLRAGAFRNWNGSSESKVQIKYCHELSEVVYEKGDADALCEAVERKGAHLKQSWPLSHGGSGCAALMALLPWDDTEVLVVAFRGTAVTVEWIEYLKGESGSGVFSMWLDTLNEIWTEQGTVPSSPTRLTMKESILNHFNESKPVWLTGHGKGGAVATTAAARLVCGKEAVESFSAGLPRLSVVTFNSPKALEPPFAEAYEEAFHQFGLRHQRIEHADDVMRELPVGLRHVGTQIEARSLAVELPDLDSSLFAAVSAHGLEVSEDDFDEDNNGNSDHDPRSPQPHHYAAQCEQESWRPNQRQIVVKVDIY